MRDMKRTGVHPLLRRNLHLECLFNLECCKLILKTFNSQENLLDFTCIFDREKKKFNEYFILQSGLRYTYLQ